MAKPEAQTDQSPAILQWGQGEPVLVFLHYFSGAAISWQWVAAALESDYRCVALDLPGFGQAPPLPQPSLKAYSAYVQQTLAQLGLDRFVLIGHSMGGKIALQVAADLKGSGLEQVVLVAPSPPTQEPMPESERQRLLTKHPSLDNAATTVDSGSQTSLPAERRQIAIETHVQAENSAWRWWLLEGMNHSIADQMGQVTVPVTVIASPEDPVIAWDMIQPEVLGVIPNSRLVALPGVGHLIPLEAPERLAQEIRRALPSST